VPSATGRQARTRPAGHPQERAQPHPAKSVALDGRRASTENDAAAGDSSRCHVAACIELLENGGTRTTQDSAALTSAAIRGLEGVLRPGDLICPSGASVVVIFGRGAEATKLDILGQRLARAVRRYLIQGDQEDLSVTIGLAAADQELCGSELYGVARSAAIAGRRRARHDRASPAALRPVPIVVDRLLAASSPTPPAEVPGDPAVGGARGLSSGCETTLRRRELLCCSGAHTLLDGAGDTTPGSRHEPRDGTSVLLVDPGPPAAGSPGLAAVAAASIAKALGYRSSVATAEDPDARPGQGQRNDVVVLVLREPTGSVLDWRRSSWHVAAELTTRYRSDRSHVLALDAGAGAAAIAGCVQRGATPVVGLDRLPSLLASTHAGSPAPARLPGPGDTSGLPPQFDALVKLTDGERRVLYYLTRGLTAQEIADDIVVSLTTVRSHIRSILSKLNVRSQLAAVAIANGRITEIRRTRAAG
jgi:DNA-binding NarL/FixJ family response regulator